MPTEICIDLSLLPPPLEREEICIVKACEEILSFEGNGGDGNQVPKREGGRRV